MSRGWMDGCVYIFVATSSVEADTQAVVGSPKSAMSLEELMRRLDSGNVKLIDVREPQEIEETGSIATSVNIPSIIAIFVFVY